MQLHLFMITLMILALPSRIWAAELLVDKGLLQLPHPGLQNEVFNLKGPWRFYQSQVLPSTGPCLNVGSAWLDIMDYWNARTLEEHPEWNGTSSFCLQIDNPAHSNLALWWPERSAVDVYANGRLVFGDGLLKEGQTRANRWRQTGVIELPHDASLTIWIHANNEFMRWRKIQGDLYLGTTESIARKKERQLIFDIFILSSLLVTAFYQFVLFTIHRDRRDTFFLGVFCLALVLRSAGLGHGSIYSILAPEAMGGRSFAIGQMAYFLGAASFYQFLAITYPDLIHRGLVKALWTSSLGLSLLVFLGGSSTYAVSLLVFHVFAGIGILSAVYVVIRAVWQKREGSRILGLGTLVMSVTAWADILRTQGMGLGFDLFPLGQLVFASAACLLVSIRFSHAFHVLSHLSHELSKIVPLHVIPLLRSGTELEQCMPTGEREAVVLVFDVVGSSRVKHPDFRKALDLCMERFFEAINHRYHPQRLEATGYRLKEMGDGVICTVGFPFKVPDGGIADTVALQLAERMCAIFHEEMARLQAAEPIYCGIGLARGPVEGFFPKAGQKQYDLRGAPLTLATRYEAMRNPVYRQWGQQGSVIFIHDAVFQNLQPHAQAAFHRWDTSLVGQKIRDDDQARQAWFKFVKP